MPRLNCSRSVESAAVQPNFPHRLLSSRSGAPTPTAPRAHFRPRRTRNLHAPESPLQSPPPAGEPHGKETPPDSRDLRFPFRHWPDTSRTATECGIRRTSLLAFASDSATAGATPPRLAFTPASRMLEGLLLRDHTDTHLSVSINRKRIHSSTAGIHGVDLRQVRRVLQIVLRQPAVFAHSLRSTAYPAPPLPPA